MLPSPFAVTLTTNYGTDTPSQVLYSGSYSIPGRNDLIPGAVYYTNTFGEIIGGDVLYGSEYTIHSNKFYYEDSKTSTLIDTSNSRVGIAISPTTISIKFN